MPTTNRPFFANFFAAFRAHNALQKSPPAIHSASATSISTTTTTAAAAAYSTLSRTYHTSSSPDPQPQSIPIPHKHSAPIPQSAHSPSSQSPTSVATAPPQSHFRSSRPLHAPNGTPQSRGRMRSSSRDEPVYGPHLPSQPQSQSQTQPPDPLSPPFRSRTPSPGGPAYGFPRGRRGSDSSAHSNGSGRPVLSASPPSASMAEKWYIGGRTAQGEERFYKLGLVRSSGSADRLSLDRLSL